VLWRGGTVPRTVPAVSPWALQSNRTGPKMGQIILSYALKYTLLKEKREKKTLTHDLRDKSWVLLPRDWGYPEFVRWAGVRHGLSRRYSLLLLVLRTLRRLWQWGRALRAFPPTTAGASPS